MWLQGGGAPIPWWNGCYKMYLAILQEEGDFTGNLSEDQWKIAADLKSLLQPFMIAQRLLEGQSYVAILLVPFMVYKVRKDLTMAVQDQLASQHVVDIGTKVLNKLNATFDAGAQGTVALDNFAEGARHRPKGIPMLMLMASLLDPRMKAGIGIPDLDKGYAWCMIKDEAIRIQWRHLSQKYSSSLHNNNNKMRHHSQNRIGQILTSHYMMLCLRRSIIIIYKSSSKSIIIMLM
jgi:hypothetical protein